MFVYRFWANLLCKLWHHTLLCVPHDSYAQFELYHAPFGHLCQHRGDTMKIGISFCIIYCYKLCSRRVGGQSNATKNLERHNNLYVYVLTKQGNSKLALRLLQSKVIPMGKQKRNTPGLNVSLRSKKPIKKQVTINATTCVPAFSSDMFSFAKRFAGYPLNF